MAGLGVEAGAPGPYHVISQLPQAPCSAHGHSVAHHRGEPVKTSLHVQTAVTDSYVHEIRGRQLSKKALRRSLMPSVLSASVTSLKLPAELSCMCRHV